MNPYSRAQVIFNMGAKIIQWGKNMFFQQTVLGQLESHMQKNEVP